MILTVVVPSPARTDAQGKVGSRQGCHCLGFATHFSPQLTSQPEDLFAQRAGQTQAILAIASQNPIIAATVPLLPTHPSLNPLQMSLASPAHQAFVPNLAQQDDRG
ncbi:hypothetical protein OOK60_02150 [Trichothermofontia sichuanensis B231]|uniref:hypothetical protein n=1 Tax=Trichothermofontia sichuanensis TaxID=3045816 RepID=UPI0022462C28|nr:hypothetical protein [Trichothermofontia sichuanensis]UZQ54908.1 hypothetical protein OOK60_02150 [Trichothermofontia sichuanensis B231]